MRLKISRPIIAVFEYLILVSIQVHLDRSEFGSFSVQMNLIYSIHNYWHSQRVSLNFVCRTLLLKCRTLDCGVTKGKWSMVLGNWR